MTTNSVSIRNPHGLMSPMGLFNPELCGGVAPHEFLFVMWLSVLVAIIGPLMPHCRHARERRPMPPSHAVSLDLSRISPS